MFNNQDSKSRKWHREAVVYQIYPRSFMDASGDGVGDLRGIIEKLDYLNDGTEKSLGVEVVWLSPIYKSPMADFGYDISDYYEIDPLFGTMEDFDELVEEIHKRGMKIIMDFVPNHTSIEHPWFIESRSSKNNPKRDWYVWKDPKPDGSSPNNWLSVFGGSVWELDSKTGQYYLHTFVKNQPDLNWRNQDVKDAMLDVLEFWLHKGVDGFRTDAIYHLIKDDQFRNDPPNPNYVLGKDSPYDALLHVYSQGRPEIFDTTNGFCEILGRHDGKFMVSEAYLDLPEMSKMYKACLHKVHAPFNFNLIYLPWIADVYRKFIDDLEKILDEDEWPNYVLGNHDRHRVATRLGEERIRSMAMILLTLRGMPFIYYGDEIGMQNVHIPPDRVQDPWEKQTSGMGFGRDPERTPMQWSGDEHAGFSETEPWLPVGSDYKKVNVKTGFRDPTSLLSLYRKLIQYRKKSPALLSGIYRSFDAGNKDVLAFVRESTEESIMVVVNFSSDEQIAHIDVENGVIVCNTFLDADEGGSISLKQLNLRPNEGYVVRV